MGQFQIEKKTNMEMISRDYNAETERRKIVEEFYRLSHINQTYDFVSILSIFVCGSEWIQKKYCKLKMNKTMCAGEEDEGRVRDVGQSGNGHLGMLRAFE